MSKVTLDDLPLAGDRISYSNRKDYIVQEDWRLEGSRVVGGLKSEAGDDHPEYDCPVDAIVNDGVWSYVSRTLSRPRPEPEPELDYTEFVYENCDATIATISENQGVVTVMFNNGAYIMGPARQMKFGNET